MHYYPGGPKEAITSLRCARFGEEVIGLIKEVLEKHNVSVEVFPSHCVLHFPEGTIRQRLYPMSQDDRYQIILPDGYILYTLVVRTSTDHTLRLPYDEFPDWIQKKYGDQGKKS